jgi:hypothetical protein
MREINFADAQQALGFLTPMQYRIENTVYQTKYPAFDYAAILPVNTEGDMWEMGSVFYSGDIAGKAEFISGRGNDVPMADVSQTQFLRENHLAAIGYEWSLQELKRAERMGTNLPASKALAASKIAQAFQYNIAISGHAEKGWSGLINTAGIPTANVAAGASGVSWPLKTADETLADINTALYDVTNNTNQTEIANRLLLPTTAIQGMAGKRMGSTSDTLLKFVRENNAYTLETGQPLVIRGLRDLETAGSGGTRRMVAFSASPEAVQFYLPGDHEFLAPYQVNSMSWEVVGLMNLGGTEVRLPKTISYRDGF